MFVQFRHTNATTGVTLLLNNDYYPFTKTLDTHIELSDRPKTANLLRPGQAPVYTFGRNRIWHVEGDIVAASMADYDAHRILLLNNILPAANPTSRWTGIITVDDENGFSYTSLVSLTSHSVPMEPLYPSVNSYMFEWESDDPFVYRVSDGAAMYI